MCKFFASTYRGLCTVIRSEAGDLPGHGDDDKAEVDRDYRNNQHLFDMLGQADVLGGPSKHVGYYDAASLYPSSGRHHLTPRTRLTPRGARRGKPRARGRPPRGRPWDVTLHSQSSVVYFRVV